MGTSLFVVSSYGMFGMELVFLAAITWKEAPPVGGNAPSGCHGVWAKRLLHLVVNPMVLKACKNCWEFTGSHCPPLFVTGLRLLSTE